MSLFGVFLLEDPRDFFLESEKLFFDLGPAGFGFLRPTLDLFDAGGRRAVGLREGGRAFGELAAALVELGEQLSSGATLRFVLFDDRAQLLEALLGRRSTGAAKVGFGGRGAYRLFDANALPRQVVIVGGG